MRPRKYILLYCEDEHERSVLKLILQLRPYRVIAGISALPPLPALIIVLVIPCARYRTMPDCYPCHAEVLRLNWTPAWLLERIHVLASRKPGPKKGSRHAGTYMAVPA